MWRQRVSSSYLNGPLPYNCKQNVLSVSLNKTFPSFLETLAANRKKIAYVAAAGFLSSYLTGPLPYNCKQNVLSASLNKIFPPPSSI